MKRKQFLKRLGITAIAAAVAPQLFAGEKVNTVKWPTRHRAWLTVDHDTKRVRINSLFEKDGVIYKDWWELPNLVCVKEGEEFEYVGSLGVKSTQKKDIYQMEFVTTKWKSE